MKPVQHNHEVVVVIPEEIKDSASRIRQHFETNKKLYYAGIGGFTLGYILRKPKTIAVVNETAPMIIVVPPNV